MGDWIDAVYLSRDAQWSIDDVKLGLVAHTGGLAENESYSASLDMVLPGVLPGSFYILVRADVANTTNEGDGEGDNLVSLPVAIGVRQLTPNSGATAGQFTADDSFDYYQLPVVDAETIALLLDGMGASGENQIFASFNQIPTPQSHELSATSDERTLNQQDQELLFDAPLVGGTLYVMVNSKGLASDSPTSYELAAHSGSFFVSGVTPDRMSNRAGGVPVNGRPVGNVIPKFVTIKGVGFTSTTVVEFIAGDGAVRTPKSAQVNSSNEILLELDFAGWTVGAYDVRIKKSAAEFVLQDAFTVVDGGAPQLETRLVLPDSVGFNIPIRQTIWIEYENTGDVPMPAPLLKLHGENKALLTTDIEQAIPFNPRTQPPPLGVSDTVQVIARGSGGTPGILQPGDSGRIPVYYLGLGEPAYGQIGFTLSTLTADAVSWQEIIPIRPGVSSGPGGGPSSIGSIIEGEDWSIGWFGPGVTHEGTLREDLRPESIPADAWAAIWANLAEQIGPDWGDYVVAMADNLNFLHTVGQGDAGIADLWNFEVAQASAALNPVRYLAGAVDASVPSTGLPLTFSRVYGLAITSRYELGPLGRGWSHNWDIRAEVESNGDVVLRGPAGVDRFFTRERDGSYSAAPGDFGRLTFATGGFRITETDQTVWQFRADGPLDSVADANGNRITLGYNAANQLTSLTHSGGQQLLLDYNAVGRLWHLTETAGLGPADDRVTTFEYDVPGEHLQRVIAPGNRVTQYAYAGGADVQREHTLTSVAFADGTHDFFDYDDFGRLRETYRDDGAERNHYEYDDAGMVTVTDGADRTTVLSFGQSGQLAKVQDGEGNVVNLQFDDLIQLVSLAGPSGERYQYSYDVRGNLASIVDPLRNLVSFTYDATFNQLTGFTDARGNGIQYRYDARGNLERIIYDDNTAEIFSYYADGNVKTWTNRRGQTVEYRYNAAGQLTSKDYLHTPTVDYRYEYDSVGNLTLAVDPNGTTILTPFPDTGLLKRIDYPGGRWFEFKYNEVGQRTKRTDQLGNVTIYNYDAAGRLDVMTDGNSALIVDYDYDPTGRLEKKTLGNSVYTTYDYDAAGNVEHLINFKPDGSVLSRYDYGYDASGRRTSMSSLDGEWTYGYDPLGQLTHAVFDSVNAAIPDQDLAYIYDGAGNRIRTIANGVITEYTTNDINQYTAVGGVTQIYDPDGNLASNTEGGVTTIYAYDAENRLVGTSTPTDAWTYEYDAFGNRVATIHNGQTTQYVIDPAGLGNLAAEYAEEGSLLARYEHGLGLLSRTDAAGSDAFYTYQAIGQTSELTGDSAEVLNSYSYDPFGISLGVSELTPNSFEYAGEFGISHDENDLIFMRARFFLPEFGRFLQLDPVGIGGGLNLYDYTYNQPTTRIDPTGFSTFEVESGGTVNVPVRINPGGKNPIQLQSPPGGPSYYPRPIPIIPLANGPQIVPWDRDAEARRIRRAEQILEAMNCFGSPLGPGDYGQNGSPNAADAIAQIANMLPGCTAAVLLALDLDDPELPDFGKNNVISRVTSHDPNDKRGPRGFGDANFVPTTHPLSYDVQFENESNATAPARLIDVRDILDVDLDLSTFELTDIAFAGHAIAVPSGLNSYRARVPLVVGPQQVSIIVDVDAHLELATRELRLTLQALNPLTGTFSENPLVGLLYPNNDSGIGEGSISYAVKPKAGLTSGTEITNRAHIVFDFNEPIDTPLVRNAIDSDAPTSHIAAIPPSTASREIELSWSGEDEPGGSGISLYELYASIDGGEFSLLAPDVVETTTKLTVEPGHKYAFYTLAIDNVGHREPAPSVPDAVVTVTLPPRVIASTVQNGLSERSFVDQLRFDFSTQVNLAALITNGTVTSAVTLTNLGVNADVDVDAPIALAAGQFHYNFNAANGESLLTLSLNANAGSNSSLPDGYYRVVLKSNQILDTAGTPLDGHADGAGGDYVFTFHVLKGDANGDAQVDAADMNLINAALGATPTSTTWNPNADLDRDGHVTVRDRVIVARADGAKVIAPAALSPSPAFVMADVNVDGAVNGADFLASTNGRKCLSTRRLEPRVRAHYG